MSRLITTILPHNTMKLLVFAHTLLIVGVTLIPHFLGSQQEPKPQREAVRADPVPRPLSLLPNQTAFPDSKNHFGGQFGRVDPPTLVFDTYPAESTTHQDFDPECEAWMIADDSLDTRAPSSPAYLYLVGSAGSLVIAMVLRLALPARERPRADAWCTVVYATAQMPVIDDLSVPSESQQA